MAYGNNYAKPYRGRSTYGYQARYNPQAVAYKKRRFTKYPTYFKKSGYYGGANSGSRNWSSSTWRSATKANTKTRRLSTKTKPMTPAQKRKWEFVRNIGIYKTSGRISSESESYSLAKNEDTICIAESMTRCSFSRSYIGLASVTDKSVINLDVDTSWAVRIVGFMLKPIGKREDLNVGQLAQFGAASAGRHQLKSNEMKIFKAAIWNKKKDLDDVDIMTTCTYSDQVEIFLDDTKYYKQGTEVCVVPEKHSIHSMMTLGPNGTPLMSDQSDGCNYIILRMFRPRSADAEVEFFKTDLTTGYWDLPQSLLLQTPGVTEVKQEMDI
ncbi:hypothetical protein SCP_1400580 [Sparassis crispa]|uniref:Uncharacterized protein n=1 Tax=Sparassis crispa TaxID=139825 RepID=A0A401H2N7_9APHY|nr:hypothetical protein SCP_1400580 [Sparassis crispa]GBE88653.1 hypothetical protein SCP_1400580 [Sparassis crispa]